MPDSAFAQSKEFYLLLLGRTPLVALRVLLAPVLVSVMVLAGCAGGTTTASHASLLLPSTLHRNSGTSQYIQHIVIIVQENRSFDDFFATFPGADGATAGVKITATRAIRRANPTTTFRSRRARLISSSLGHELRRIQKDYDDGKMDGFPLVKMALRKGKKYQGTAFIPTSTSIQSTFSRTGTSPSSMFSATTCSPTQGSGSFTAHQALIAGGIDGQSGRLSADRLSEPFEPWGCDAPSRVR